MSALSPAARGQRRGLLEILAEPPALFTNMESPEHSYLSTVNTYSIVGIAASTGMMASGIGIPGFMALVYFIGLIASLCAFFSSAYFALHEGADQSLRRYDRSVRERVLEGVQNAADRSVRGSKVSLSESIADSIMWKEYRAKEYVENLTPRQKRWVAKQWEIALSEAMDTRKNGRVSGIADIDSIVDPERVKRISANLDELEKLRNQTVSITDFDSFDREMRSAS